MFMKSSTKIKCYLSIVITQKIKNITAIQYLSRRQNERSNMWQAYKRFFVEWKSKMYICITGKNH